MKAKLATLLSPLTLKNSSTAATRGIDEGLEDDDGDDMMGRPLHLAGRV